MWEEWLYKTIIAFLSIQVIQIVFKKYIGIMLKKTNTKVTHSRIRGLINAILVSMIPFLRWVFVGCLVFVSFAGVYYSNEK